MENYYIFDNSITNHETLGFGYSGTSSKVPSQVSVDITGFKLPKAKIDCITFDFLLKDEVPALISKFQSQLTKGWLKHPRNLHKVVSAGRMWITIHDPSIRDLQRLIDYFPMARITYIEFAVDFHLPDDCWEIDRVWTLARQFRHCLYPQMDSRFSKARRKYFNVPEDRYKNDGLGTPYKESQILYEDFGSGEKLAMYVKEKDNGHVVNKPWVRIEAKFKGTGLTRLGLEDVPDLVTFADVSRMSLSQAFWVAKGFEEKTLPRGHGFPLNPWPEYGAQYAVRNTCTLIPDRAVNVAIGKALCRLRESLLRLAHSPR